MELLWEFLFNLNKTTPHTKNISHQPQLYSDHIYNEETPLEFHFIGASAPVLALESIVYG